MDKFTKKNSALKFIFKRWSNKAFAAFNSIGREVIIGFVSGILESLNTVKSVSASNFQEINERIASNDCAIERSSECSLDETIGRDFFLDSLFVLRIRKNSIVGSEKLNFINYIVLTKALLGPFLLYHVQKPFNNY